MDPPKHYEVAECDHPTTMNKLCRPPNGITVYWSKVSGVTNAEFSFYIQSMLLPEGLMAPASIPFELVKFCYILSKTSTNYNSSINLDVAIPRGPLNVGHARHSFKGCTSLPGV